jgi:hypothetical protein
MRRERVLTERPLEPYDPRGPLGRTSNPLQPAIPIRLVGSVGALVRNGRREPKGSKGPHDCADRIGD